MEDRMKRITEWIGVAMLAAAPAIAQVPSELLQGTPSRPDSVAKPPARGQAKDFGTGNFYTSIDSFGMTPFSSDMLPQRTITTGLWCSLPSTESRAVGQVILPHGVDIQVFRVWANDNTGTDDMLVTLQSACLPDAVGGLPTLTTLATVTSAGAGGSFTSADVVAGTVLADNTSCTYQVIVRFGNTNAACEDSLFFYKARVQWDRMIPLAPAVASFVDVPTNAQFFREIEALADTGITAGCTATEFCPDQFVTRRQMAAFLARALGLQPSNIPDPANP
jgi:hypothetical protein